jgi:NAD+ diphosphatase
MRATAGFAFGTSDLDRAVSLRTRPDEIAALLAAATTQILPIWRGKPLFEGARLGFVPPRHPVLAQTDIAPVLLGAQGGQVWFAQDISSWQPENAPLTGGAFSDPSEQTHPELPASACFTELRNRMVALEAREAELAGLARWLTGWHATHRFCAACGQQSTQIEAGWQRLCPRCGARHFPRTDPVVIMLITRGNMALIGRSPGWPEGMYSCLAGFMEPGETIEIAVRREVREETGVSVGAVRYVASQPWPFPSSLMIGCHGVALDAELQIDPVELEDALWISREEMALVMAGAHAAIRAPRRGAIAAELLRQWLAGQLD